MKFLDTNFFTNNLNSNTLTYPYFQAKGCILDSRYYINSDTSFIKNNHFIADYISNYSKPSFNISIENRLYLNTEPYNEDNYFACVSLVLILVSSHSLLLLTH